MDPRVSIDYRIVPGSFPNPIVSAGVCYTAVGRCRRRLDRGMVGYCVGVLLFTSFGLHCLPHGRGMRIAGVDGEGTEENGHGFQLCEWVL